MWQFGWIISLIPDSLLIWITYAIVGAGFLLYVASKLTAWIPIISQYKLPAELLGVICLVIGSYLFGSYGTEMVWRERVAELQKKVKVEIQERIVYKTKVVKEKETIYVDRIKEIAKEVDAKCEVDPRVIEELNKASEDPFKGDSK